MHLPKIANLRQPPIIVLGMHRSGTSLFVKLLEGLGVFMGADLDSNNESRFFASLNNWLLSQASCTWDNPTNLDVLQGDDRQHSLVLNYVNSRLKHISRLKYFGVSGITNSVGSYPGQLWGWKDPRNTFTLPIWLDLFPNSKIIVLERNGVDVANSLISRKNKALDVSVKHSLVDRLTYATVGRRQPFGTSAHLNSQLEASSLWLKYLEKGREHCVQSGLNSISIKYEDFLENPDAVTQKMIRFLDIKETTKIGEAVERVTSSIDKSRANSYKHSNDKISAELLAITERY